MAGRAGTAAVAATALSLALATTAAAVSGSDPIASVPGPVAFASVRGVATDPAGNVYAAVRLQHRVVRIAPDGAVTTIAGTGVAGYNGDGIPATTAQLSHPAGVAVGADGDVYIADELNGRVRRVDPGGIITTVAGGLAGPIGVAISPGGFLHVAEYGGHRVSRFGIGRPGGALDPRPPLPPLPPIVASSFERLAVIGGGLRPVAGTGVAGFGGDGGAATEAQLSNPTGIGFAPDGSLLIADQGNHRIRRVSDGTIATIAGTGTSGFSGDGGVATAARLAQPTGVAVDRSGNVFIADQANERIRKVSPAGTIATIAGDGVEGLSGDGGPASGARLRNPFGVALDAGGSLLVADELNDRVRRIANVAPVPSIAAAPAGGAAPVAVSFDASASTDPNDAIVSYAWDFGDGGAAAGPTAGHTYAAPGSYTVRLEVRDDSGAVAAATRVIEVTAPPQDPGPPPGGGTSPTDGGGRTARDVPPQGSDKPEARSPSAGTTGGGGPVPDVRLTSTRLEPRWRQSRFVGRLSLAGTARRRMTVTVEIRRQGAAGKPLVVRRLKLGKAGRYAQRIKVGTALLPGTYVVRLKAPQGFGSSAQQVVRLAAPAEGVVSRAFISTAIGGAARTEAPAGTRLLVTNFIFAALPARGQRPSVTWFWSGTSGPVAKIPKTRTKRVTALLTIAGEPLRRGFYRAELRAGRTLVATARIRVR